MPRFFFHFRDGETFNDEDGYELDDLVSARLEAIRRLGKMIADNPARLEQDHDWRIEVADKAGLRLCRVDLMLLLSDSPSMHPKS